MDKSINLRTGRHVVFDIHIHLVFVPKYRRNIFTKEILLELEDIFQAVCEDFESTLIEFDGEGNHVHLIVNYPPKVSVSNIEKQKTPH
jgi:putative transposase